MALWPEEPRTVGNQGLSPLISPFTRERHFGRKKRWSLISFTGIAERLLSSCLSHKKKIHFSEYFDSVSGKFIVIYLDTCIFFFLPFYMVCLHSMFMFFSIHASGKANYFWSYKFKDRSIDDLPEVSNKDA